jgi:hypothetical protein
MLIYNMLLGDFYVPKSNSNRQILDHSNPMEADVLTCKPTDGTTSIIGCLLAGIWILLFWGGCTDNPLDAPRDFLVRVESSRLSPGDFQQAFEVYKSAYAHNDMLRPDVFRTAQLRLLNQLTDELILMERAKELNLFLSDTEKKAAVSDMTRGYPEGAFEKALLEQAISYRTWENRLVRRLLMEKVIAVDLKDRAIIAPEEMAGYYRAQDPARSDIPENPDLKTRQLVERMRWDKAETAYGVWMKGFRDRYSIEVNRVLWEEMFGT